MRMLIAVKTVNRYFSSTVCNHSAIARDFIFRWSYNVFEINNFTLCQERLDLGHIQAIDHQLYGQQKMKQHRMKEMDVTYLCVGLQTWN